MSPKAPLPLLDLLLLLQSDMRARPSGPILHIGIPDIGRFHCFMEGYGWCLSHLGIHLGEDNLFSGWLQNVKHAWSDEGWETACLRESGGDPTRAISKYLDDVAEFRSLPPGNYEVTATLRGSSGEERATVSQQVNVIAPAGQ